MNRSPRCPSWEVLLRADPLLIARDGRLTGGRQPAAWRRASAKAIAVVALVVAGCDAIVAKTEYRAEALGAGGVSPLSG
jgi:hypothetical protein